MRSMRITIVVLLSLVAALLAVAGRCVYLQYRRGDHYHEIWLRQQQGLFKVRPRRGVILDSRGRMLAASNNIQTVFVEPRVITEPKLVATELGNILDMPAHEICKTILESGTPGFVKIKVDVEQATCDEIRKARIYGAGIQSDWSRYYPMGSLAAHVTGFTSADNRGLGGVELRYDKDLRGSEGKSRFLADALRRPVRLTERQQQSDGVGLILTIDSTIQQFAQTELFKQYKTYEAESAVAVVMEPSTGAILAIVSLPDFDPAASSSADPESLKNRALTDIFEPGSVMKPIVAAIAIDAGAVGLYEKIYCEEGVYRGKGFGRIGEYGNHAFEDLSVEEIIIKSSNIGMAKIGQKLGRDKMYKGLKLFGFGRKTGIDLPGEDSGLLWPVKRWTGYSVTRIPFGQEISVTAVQMVRAFCILANGGHPIQPFVVRAIVGTDGEITKIKRSPAEVGFVIRPEVANSVVHEALVGVIEEGTGKKAALERWQVFGKTGTANIARSDGPGYDESSYVASFIGGAPAEDPAVVILVAIRKPNRKLGKGYTGGTVAAPVAREILEKTLSYMEANQIIGIAAK